MCALGGRALPCALLAALLAAAPVQAQDAPAFEPRVHWAYASFFGSGWYEIDSQRSTFILRTAPRRQFGEAEFDEDGRRRIAYTARLPLTIGLASLDIEDIPGIVDPDNLAIASLAVSLDAEIPVTERLNVRPSAEVGYGTVVGETDRAWTWRGQLSGRYAFDTERVEWSLVGELGAAGYEPVEGPSDNFSFATIGTEVGYPVRWFPAENDQTLFYSHVKYTHFVDDIDFDSGIGGLEPVANVWEVGFAVGRRDNPIRIWRFSFDRLGLGIKASPQSELRGIVFVFRSIYEL